MRQDVRASRGRMLPQSDGRVLLSQGQDATRGEAGCLPFCQAGCRCAPFGQNKNRLLKPLLQSDSFDRPEKRLQRDGSQRKAGDGTRTRDSLLERQAVAESTRYAPELALQANPGVFIVNRAAKT
jgi:hypothetical protein